jgi:hypothetical protein
MVRPGLTAEAARDQVRAGKWGLAAFATSGVSVSAPPKAKDACTFFPGSGNGTLIPEIFSRSSVLPSRGDDL